jgi:hypothetical protein
LSQNDSNNLTEDQIAEIVDLALSDDTSNAENTEDVNNAENYDQMLFNPQTYYVMVLKQLGMYEAILHTPDTVQQQKLKHVLRPMLSLTTFDNFDNAYATYRQTQAFISSYKKQKLAIETQLTTMEADFDVQVNRNFGPLQPVTYV